MVKLTPAANLRELSPDFAAPRISPLILHLPHSSTLIPARYRHIYLQPEQLPASALAAADLFTDQLYRYPAATLRFPVSRLLCDVERFRDPAAETMTKLGMWICYTHTLDGSELARFDDAHVRDILRSYYDVHHAAFTAAVAAKLKTCGRALIVDGHSFPARLPYYPPGDCPDICLGQDAFHTPPALVRTCCRYLEAWGYTVAVNFPFSGSIVPLAYYRQDQRVQSIMLEAARDLYVDQRQQKSPGYAKLHAAFRGLLQLLDQL
ncbi:MAG: N-formylglutamate amidohydrolase [Acidaminococcaceae bacterium]|jgi:N-formylglutamate deformylase|nr:N-formylglutamate amidohydrolase [Acidaminococcaceae bacterium]